MQKKLLMLLMIISIFVNSSIAYAGIGDLGGITSDSNKEEAQKLISREVKGLYYYSPASYGDAEGASYQYYDGTHAGMVIISNCVGSIKDISVTIYPFENAGEIYQSILYYDNGKWSDVDNDMSVELKNGQQITLTSKGTSLALKQIESETIWQSASAYNEVPSGTFVKDNLKIITSNLFFSKYNYIAIYDNEELVSEQIGKSTYISGDIEFTMIDDTYSKMYYSDSDENVISVCDMENNTIQEFYRNDIWSAYNDIACYSGYYLEEEDAFGISIMYNYEDGCYSYYVFSGSDWSIISSGYAYPMEADGSILYGDNVFIDFSDYLTNGGKIVCMVPELDPNVFCLTIAGEGNDVYPYDPNSGNGYTTKDWYEDNYSYNYDDDYYDDEYDY